MNILTQVLPGLRDARAPLVAGYLWLAVAWVNQPLFSDELAENEFVRRVQTELELANPVAVALATGVLAYLIGVLMRVAATVAVVMAGPALLVVVPLFLVDAFTSSRWFYALDALGVVAVAVAISLFKSPSDKADRNLLVLAYSGAVPLAAPDPWRPVLAVSLLVGGVAACVIGVRRIRPEELTPRERRACLVLEVVADAQRWGGVAKVFGEQIVAPSYAYRRLLLGVLDFEDDELRALLLGLPVHRLKILGRRVLLSQGRVMTVVAYRQISEDLLRIYVRPQAVRAIQERLLEVVVRSPDAQAALVGAALSNAEWKGFRRRMARRIDLLLLDRERVSDQVDRLRSEGDYRFELALPVTALCVSVLIAFHVQDDYSRWWLLVALLPALLLLFAARNQYVQRNNDLLESLSLDLADKARVLIDAPALHDLSRPSVGPNMAEYLGGTQAHPPLAFLYQRARYLAAMGHDGDPEHAHTIGSAAKALHDAGHPQLAVEFWQRLYELRSRAPELGPAREALGFLALALHESGKSEEAVDLLPEIANSETLSDLKARSRTWEPA